jgi:hypothetical protein
MSLVRFFKKLARSISMAEVQRVRTWDVGQIIEYDDTRNAAKILLCVKGIRPEDPENDTTLGLPVLEDVPVRQEGSGKLLKSCGPAPGSYGIVLYSHRDIEAWLTTGGVVDPANTRRWDLSDAVFLMGLYPFVADGDNGMIEEPIKTDRISLRTRSGLTEISVLEDESVAVNINDGAANVTIDVDGNVSIISTGDILTQADGKVTTSATETVVQDGTDYAVQFTAMKSAFDTLKSELNALVTIFNAHIHPGVLAGGASTAVTATPGTPPAATMDSAKVNDVRFP